MKQPTKILKQLSLTINKILNELSSNEETFNRIKQDYQAALKSFYLNLIFVLFLLYFYNIL